jgi:predicted dehydrogenase
MGKSHPVRVAIIGMGGFAAAHHRAVRELERRGQAQLVATCDPDLGAFSSELGRWKDEGRRIATFDDTREMLAVHARDLDVLAVPTPIQLHAEMHRAGVEAGVAVYLEKPPTLDPDQFESMVEVEAKAVKSTLVGFNFVVEPERIALKQRLLGGEFGRLKRVSFVGAWPRPEAYFARNGWAGRLRLADQIILDSCFGNAMAHFAHASLLWAGSEGPCHRASVRLVRARLHRVHDIEGPDTCFVEAETTTGVSLRFAETHAWTTRPRQIETLSCERATVRYVAGSDYEIAWRDGAQERGAVRSSDVVADNYLAYFDYLAGASRRPPTTLGDTRAFVELNALAYVSSAAISPLAARSRQRVEDGESYFEVEGLDAELDDFAAGGDALIGARWVTPEQVKQLGTTLQQLRG